MRLESTILDYYPTIERIWVGKRTWDYPLFGRAQLVLLGAIDANRRSRRATLRLEELRRKFASQEISPPTSLHAQFFTPRSPIPTDKAEKMSDEQWLKAISKYTTSRSGRWGGSASELSTVLQEQVGHDPRRFANLLLRFPDTIDLQYFGSVLMGLAYTHYDAATLLKICEHCHNPPGRPCGHYIVQVIAALGSGPLPKRALQLVAWYAVEEKDYARTAAAEAMAQLIQADPHCCQYFIPTVQKIVKGEAGRPKHTILWVLREVLQLDRDLAVSLFADLCQKGRTATPRSPLTIQQPEIRRAQGRKGMIP